MNNKLYTAIGLMSGTSMDGVDASLIRSNGIDEFTKILNEYHEYDTNLHECLIDLRNIILNSEDLEKYSSRIDEIEREITLFHGKIIDQISLKYNDKIDFNWISWTNNLPQSLKKKLPSNLVMVNCYLS
jgi:anhydro-N-acetylmuramic acid kinase